MNVVLPALLRVVRQSTPLWWSAVLLLALAGRYPGEAVADPSMRGQAAFDAGLEEAQDLLGRGRCDRGLALVQELLQEHEGASYARVRRTEIEDVVFRLAFGAQHTTPKAKDVVSGELQRYVPKTGKIRIRYTPDTQGDLENVDEWTLAFPARMRRSFTVILEGGRCRDGREKWLGVGNEADPETGKTQLWVLYAGGAPDPTSLVSDYTIPRLDHRDSDTVMSLGMKASFHVRGHRPFVMKIEVRPRKISGLLNGTTIGKGSKSPKVYGHIAFRAWAWERLTIEGTVEPSWVQGRIDAVVQERLAAFREAYDPSAHLPAWLLAEASEPTVAASEQPARWPDGTDPLREAALDAVEAALWLGHVPAARSQLADLERLGANPSALSYLRAIDHLRSFRLAKALKFVDAALQASPAFVPAQLLRGRILGRLGRAEESRAIFGAAEARYPRSPMVYERVVTHYLRTGHLDAARGAYDRALANGASSDEMDLLGSALVKAANGPAWTKVHEYRSPHYHVFSDIDTETCRRAAKTLEEAHAVYQRTMKRVARDGRRFTVYLFRGQEGFRTYLEELGALGGSPPLLAAGMYSSLLKQLLIWNLPNREMMLGTVRHEGLHQYLDRILPDVPVWFNEGLAVYYERGHRVAGRLYFGKPQQDYLRALSRGAPQSIRKLLAMGPHEFYAGGVRNYAQAWAFVHMLREGDETWRALFEQLLADFEAMPMHDALARAFAKIDPEELQVAFDVHVRSLRK